jgi:hypothetical protein
MFHVFRSLEHENDNKTTPEHLVSDEYKKHHARRHRLRVSQARRSLQNLLLARRQWPFILINQHQVTINYFTKDFYKYL